MADVKCPMCGKPNPADAEICEYCQARIKPLIIGDQEQSDPSDWLAGLRLTNDSNPQPSQSEEPPAEQDSSDWLARIRARHQTETPAEETSSAGDENISDWLADLRQGVEEPAPLAEDLNQPLRQEAPFNEDMQEAPASIEEAIEAKPGEPHSSDEETPAFSDHDLGWLSAFQSTQPDSSNKSDQDPTTPVEASDWLESIGASTPSTNAELDNDLGWLSAFQQDATSSEEARLTPATETPADVPAGLDWLGEDTSTQPINSETKAEENLDWLNAFQPDAISEEEVPITPATETPTEPTSVLDWLEESSPTEQVAPEPKAEEDLGWLSAFQPSAASEIPSRPETETPASETIAETSPSISEPSTDFAWLADLVPNEPPLPVEPSSQGVINPFEESTEIQTPAPDALPEWLVRLQNPPSEPTQPIEPVQPAQPEQPEWLRNFSTESSDPDLPTNPFTIPVEDLPVAPDSASRDLVLPGQEIPDWLSDLTTDASSTLPTAPAFLPDDQLAPTVPESTAALFGGEDLPEWIGQEEASREVEKPAEESPAEELEPAQLPTWLQTMRPVEAVAPSPSSNLPEDNRVEKAGPLAGLRGLVNGSESVTQYQKPPLYSVKLQVTERQRLHANLLENILESETQATVSGKETRLSPQRILRGVVTLLLLAVLLIPLILQLPAPLQSDPDAFPTFIAGLGQLNQGDDVLLAVEYDPGLAAELEGSAIGLLKWLEQRQASVSLISTNPAGPALAEALLQTTWSREAIQASSANLGYIAGGSTALAQLATASLQQQLSLSDLVKRPLRLPEGWTVQPSFNQFKAIILLTDNIETGRAWVEQISPALGETPLLIISSAQAAPVLQAYTGTQVQSLMTGSSQTGTSRLAAYQFGMLFAAILILFGGLVQGLLSLFKHSRKAQEG